MALLTETNEQYYAGEQSIIAITGQTVFTWTGDTSLIATVSQTSNTNYSVLLNNVLLVETTDYTLSSIDTITLTGAVPALVNGDVIIIRLNDTAVWNNYGGYAYITIEEIVNNFLVAYVGAGKLIPSVKRTDVIFHAKRGLQEFSYDTLKSIKSQELTIPPSLSIIIPQDYVNYVKLSYIDDVGIKHIIYPTTLTSNPFTVPIQDANGVPTQDSLGANLEGTSQTNERWDTNNLFTENLNNQESLYYDYNNWYMYRYGRRYGLQPEVAQSNGWFTIR